MSTVPTVTPVAPSTDPKCSYCAGTGRWTKEIFPGKPESVYCPHCHGSGKGGAADSSLPGD